ncbi:MAG: NapC/NirT family cytochrome c [bacterium]|nr:NapC/NirT family cytochrome c [bacterium]
MRFMRFKWTIIALGAVAAVAALGVGGLYGIRALESYDPFCTSCHLQDHQVYLDDGGRAKADVRTLGGWHLAGGKAGCISCHGEDGIFGMMQTTWLAAGDTVKFVTGDYKQPSRVFHPIKNKDCLKCHPEDRVLDLPEGSFHAITDHAELSFSCVQCHSGHKVGGRREKKFLVPNFAQPRCDKCHEELEQKVRVGALKTPPSRIPFRPIVRMAFWNTPGN